MSLNNKEKIMKLTNNLIVLAFSLSMIGCGGGGGSDSSTTKPAAPVVSTPVQPIVTPVATPAVTPVTTPDPNAVYETTAELVVAKDFMIKQEYDLTIAYTDDANREVYLSICSDFTNEQSTITVNYNSCILRTANNGDYTNTLNIPNDKSQLVMAIWYLDDLNNPRYEFWNNDEATETTKVFDVNL